MTSRIPLAKQGQPVSFQLYARGGAPPYTWQIYGLDGSGIQWTPSGLLWGTADAIGSYNLTVQVFDSNNNEAQTSLLLTVYDGGFLGAIDQSFFGLNLHDNGAGWPSVSTDQNPFSAVRLWDCGTMWLSIEHSQGNFDWSRLDSFVSDAQANGVKVLYEVGQTPAWASSDPNDSSCKYGLGACDAPADWSYFSGYMTQLVQRYSSQGSQANGVIHMYELWNEPSVAREWNPKQPNAMSNFVTMTQIASRIIRAYDPNAMILAPSGSVSWMKHYWRDGGPTDFDYVTTHEYDPTYAIPENMIGLHDLWMKVLSHFGIQSPIFNTEGSYGSARLPDIGQKAYAARYLLLNAGLRVASTIWYMWDNGASLWDSNLEELTNAGEAYRSAGNWLLGANITSAGCEDSSGNFVDISRCPRMDNHYHTTYLVNLARPGGYRAQAVWFVEIDSGNTNWQATSPYNVPDGFTQCQDLDGFPCLIANGAVTIGAAPILLENPGTGP